MQKIRRSRELYLKQIRANPQHAKPCETPLGIFKSATEAAKAHGLTPQSISTYCKGEYLDAETGIIWRYLSKPEVEAWLQEKRDG